MKSLKKFDWSFKSILKIFGLLVVIILAIIVLITGIQYSYRLASRGLSISSNQMAMSPAYDAEEGYFTSDVAGVMKSEFMPEPGPGYSTGNDAEAFEVKRYDATIKSKKLEETCSIIARLKEKAYVIFESSNENDESCSYQFKVEKANAESILAVIQDLKPYQLNTNITSIKASVENVQTEIDILNKKLESVEKTLEEAQTAYDEISQLATSKEDAETLAKIIDSKLNLIEKLTNERMNIKSQIDYYNKNKADQLDQLDYTFFSVYIEKDLIFDWKAIKDNWKYETRQWVGDLSGAIQAISLNLVLYLAYVLLGMIYLFVSVFFLKWAWHGIKKIWGIKSKK